MDLINSKFPLSWLGGHKPDNCVEVKPTDCWEYTDGSNWYFEWYPGQPNKIGTGQCLMGTNYYGCQYSGTGIYIFDDGVPSDSGCSFCQTDEVFVDGACTTTIVQYEHIVKKCVL